MEFMVAIRRFPLTPLQTPTSLAVHQSNSEGQLDLQKRQSYPPPEVHEEDARFHLRFQSCRIQLAIGVYQIGGRMQPLRARSSLDLQAGRAKPRKRNLLVSQIERPYVRQCSGGAEVHRESAFNRWLQVRPATLRLRAVVSSSRRIFVQGRIGAFRHGEILPGASERSFPASNEFLAEQIGPGLHGEKGARRFRLQMDFQAIEKIFRASWILRLAPLAEDSLFSEPNDPQPGREHTEIFQLLRILRLRRIDRRKLKTMAVRGLPVCNTGLSLFTIWSSSPVDGDQACAARTAKKKSRSCRGTDAFLNICTELRPTLGQSTTNDASNSWSRYNPLLVDKYIPRGFRGSNPESRDKTSVWDNGKDWGTPCAKEGGWIRIYPLTRIKPENPVDYATSLPESAKVAEKETRNAILSIQKYLKAAKETQKKNEKFRDEQCNAMLRKMLQLNTEIWLPSK